MTPEKVTSYLDLAGLLLLAFGVGAWLYPFIGLACTAGSAVVVLGGSRLIVWITNPGLAPKWWRWMRGER